MVMNSLVVNYCFIDILFVLLDIVWFDFMYVFCVEGSVIFCLMYVFFDSFFFVVLFLSMFCLVLDRYMDFLWYICFRRIIKCSVVVFVSFVWLQFLFVVVLWFNFMKFGEMKNCSLLFGQFLLFFEVGFLIKVFFILVKVICVIFFFVGIFYVLFCIFSLRR